VSGKQTKMEKEVADAHELRQCCNHVWKSLGFDRCTAALIEVIYICEKCTSFTYRQMQFVGFQLNWLPDIMEGLDPKDPFQRACIEGQLTGELGKDREKNPYSKEDARFSSWDLGWRKARRP
jgi:ribosome modulation factor